MIVVEKSLLVAYSAEQMFRLVDDVERYPEFMPWCGGAKLREQTGDDTVATLWIDFMSVKQSFTTANERRPPHLIDMKLQEGPFRDLRGQWHFRDLAESACKVSFKLEYEFSSSFMERVIGPVFSRITNSFVDAFVRRAENLYGES